MHDGHGLIGFTAAQIGHPESSFGIFGNASSGLSVPGMLGILKSVVRSKYWHFALLLLSFVWLISWIIVRSHRYVGCDCDEICEGIDAWYFHFTVSCAYTAMSLLNNCVCDVSYRWRAALIFLELPWIASLVLVQDSMNRWSIQFSYQYMSFVWWVCYSIMGFLKITALAVTQALFVRLR